MTIALIFFFMACWIAKDYLQVQGPIGSVVGFLLFLILAWLTGLRLGL